MNPDPNPTPTPDPNPPVPPTPTPDPTPEPTPEQARIAALNTQMEAMRRENAEYKRRDDEARRAKLTEEQRVTEELTALKAERDQMASENLRRRIASEYKLPDTAVNRLIGTDEAGLRADAEELAKLFARPKAGNPTDPVRDTQIGGKKVYTRAELKADPTLAASPEVLQAAREGRVR